MRSFFSGWVAVFLGTSLLVACSASRSERIGSECISDRQCGSGGVCESGSCTTTDSDSASVTGKIAGAPEGTVIAFEDAAKEACAQRQEKGVFCELSLGGRVTLIAPEIEGYRFAGWTGKDDDARCVSKLPVLTLKKVERSTTCTAHYVRRVRVAGEVEGETSMAVTATSESPFASCEGASCEVDVGDTVVLLAPERDGHRIESFSGEGCEDRAGYRVSATPTEGDILCTAQYVESLTVRGQTQGLSPEDALRVEAMVRASSPGEGIYCEGQLCAVNGGDSVSLQAPELDGYRFRGWTGDPICLGTELTLQVIDVRTNVLCIADYVARFAVKGVSEGADAPIVASSENLFSDCAGALCAVDRGESVTLQAGTVEGYRLKSWSGEGCETLSGASAIARNVESDLTCTAHYVEGVSVTGTVVNAAGEVEAVSDANGADCGRGSCAIDIGGSVTLRAPPLPGRTFLGWSGDPGCTGSDLTLTLRDVTTSKSCSATFAARYTVTVRATPEQSGQVTASSGAHNATCTGTRCEVDEGSAVVLTATPLPKFRFTGWSGGGPCAGNASRLDLRSVNASVTCNANFVARIVVSGDPAPTNAGVVTATQLSLTSDCAGNRCTIDSGTNVLLSAKPRDGYQFTTWIGCGSIFNPLLGNPDLFVLGPTTDVHCTANFEKITYPVTALGSEGGSATVSIGFINCASNVCMVEHGGSATVTAVPEVGWDFDRWTGCSPGFNGSIGDVRAAVTCTATFRREPVTITGTANTPFASITASSPGQLCTGASCTVEHGSSVNLTAGATDPEGFRFESWQACAGAGVSGRTLTIASATNTQTCTARYTQIPRVTVSVDYVGTGAGAVGCVGGCTVYQGQTVTLTATPDPEHVFDGWTCTGGVTVNSWGTTSALAQNVSCDAIFLAPLPPAVPPPEEPPILL